MMSSRATHNPTRYPITEGAFVVITNGVLFIFCNVDRCSVPKSFCEEYNGDNKAIQYENRASVVARDARERLEFVWCGK